MSNRSESSNVQHSTVKHRMEQLNAIRIHYHILDLIVFNNKIHAKTEESRKIEKREVKKI